MATTKAKETVAEEMIHDDWEDMVTIRLPRNDRNEANYEIASVNGKTYKIRRGEDVQVPLPIAKVLEHSARMREEALDYIESKAE